VCSSKVETAPLLSSVQAILELMQRNLELDGVLWR
jgi:hypothetical protein